VITADLKGVYPFVEENEIFGSRCGAAEKAHRLLESGSGEGGEYTGWFRLPSRIGSDELSEIEDEGKRIASDSEVLLVIGVGGSYLGSKALVDMLYHENGTSGTNIVYAGNGLSSRRIVQLKEYLADKDFSINIISKSGGTLEPAISLRIFYDLLTEKYGTGRADARITATTDARHGNLLNMAKERGWKRFVIPADVGGRYGALTAAGLLPCAAAGADIRAIIKGAKNASEAYALKSADNPVWQYAASRRALYDKGFTTELLCIWEPQMRWFGEWWKQLFGESEGKCGRGIFPASLEMTADLHSMGQYIQQGPRNIMETMLSVCSGPDVIVPAGKAGKDGFDFLEGQFLCQIAEKTLRAVTDAHVSGGVPVIGIKSDAMKFEGAGELIYFFELACGISSYMDCINPFNQPGVEEYKKNMFRLLGKPGF